MSKQAKQTPGGILRALRKGKGLTQLQLCQDICSERTLRDIEKDIILPSKEVLELLLKECGSSLEEYNKQVYGIDTSRFESDFAKLWDILYDKNYKAFATGVEVLKNAPYYTMTIPTTRQAMLLLEAAAQSSDRLKHHQTLKMLAEALGLTKGHLLGKGNWLDNKAVATSILTMNEGRIIKLMAFVLSDSDLKKAINISLALIESLEDSNAFYHVCKKLLPSTYFNTSDMLIDDEQYENALDLAEDGISYSMRVNEFKFLAKLYTNKGEALCKLGDFKQGKEAFAGACRAARLYQNKKTEESIRSFVKKHYDMEL